MSKISDYKLAASSLREVCRIFGVPFVDLSVDFDKEQEVVKDGVLHIGKTDSLGQAQINMVTAYINNAENIVGKRLFLNEEQGKDFLLHFATMMRKVMISDGFFEEALSDSPHYKRLYQEPFLWILMKDLICPLHGIQLHDTLIMCGSSLIVDGSKFYTKEDINNDNIKEDFVFINYDMQNVAARNAHAILEIIEEHGLDSHSVMRGLFESEFYEKIKGLARLAFVEDESVEEFIAILFKILDFRESDFPHVKMASVKKESQAYDSAQVPNTMQWWYMGLTEKMLEPVRGYDWSTYQSLEKYIEQFWNRVEEIKAEKKQGEGIPFNQLLRLKNKQTVDDPELQGLTIQGLLKSQRIW